MPLLMLLGAGPTDPDTAAASLGAKGAGIEALARLGLPVPAGFVLTTDACRAYMDAGQDLTDALHTTIDQGLAALQASTGLHLGDAATPLRLSVRPSPPVPMPGLLPATLGLADRASLDEAVRHTWDSYRGARARYHRRKRHIPEDVGLALIVQVMVGGEVGSADTRDPATGESNLVGTGPVDALAAHVSAIEGTFTDACHVGFSVDRGQLWLLGVRPSSRSPTASVRIAVDLVHDGLIDEDRALGRVEPSTLERVLRPTLAPSAEALPVLGRGLGASPGAATGRVALNPETAQEYRIHGDPVLLLRTRVLPSDLGQMSLAAAILTARGGPTSHAAVVARTLGKPCVVGCAALSIHDGVATLGDRALRDGDWLTIDGGEGRVLDGQATVVPAATDSGALDTLLGWADARTRLRVRANADSARDAQKARALGARGIGLCRTEHMFFEPDALRAMQRMIVADNADDRARALAVVEPLQRREFADIFRAMDGLPVTIRLLDPPLHEFLPRTLHQTRDVALELGVRTEVLAARLVQLREVNPMLGHRGCRVGVTTPAIYRAQSRAIFSAACDCVEEGVNVRVEVMIPLVSSPRELEICRDHVTEAAQEILTRRGVELRYKVGSMIEVPRACLVAGSIARHADFFSFGTNDLSQLAYGFSRDDIGGFLPGYLERHVLDASPFEALDEEGVGQLVKLGTQRGRHANARLLVGACGEHAGSPGGVAFFHKIGLDHVSCSPFRVPVARLAAAWAALGLL